MRGGGGGGDWRAGVRSLAARRLFVLLRASVVGFVLAVGSSDRIANEAFEAI